MSEHKIWAYVHIGQVPNNLTVRGYEPGREDHEFDPRLGNFFLSMRLFTSKLRVVDFTYVVTCVRNCIMYSCVCVHA